ncbi:glycine betaine ABC transporter substrate-binding protein [Candidatus Parabeggiatoa sp. HSG14]|uniref:glycine betaine ABC transporter substrate-binding protein n=1 Tax=Candidatus Parabeggiatoa sp. HSG14 TaxID=3055593 RepID=UPI0025A90335|nr:glycine betaine ABC transporter substrate-binding protein [Thiotrichales bacterium HSG14]
MKNSLTRILHGIVASLAFIVGSLGMNAINASTDDPKGEIVLTYVEWSSEVASANVIKVVLEELHYQVDIVPVTAVFMWQAVASGDADGLVAAWLHTTHAHYMRAVKSKVEYLGPNLKGTKVGLVVPSYVSINSIKELNINIDKFKGEIIGIDPGAGLMSKTEQAMKDYQLEDFKLVKGSGVTMTTKLENAIKNNQWIVVTGWTPHWKFSRWNLKYLKDDKGIFNPPKSNLNKKEEHIGTIVRLGLKKDMPEVYGVLDKFYWEPADMEKVMVWNSAENADPYENAKRWVNENRDKVQKWISPN